MGFCVQIPAASAETVAETVTGDMIIAATKDATANPLTISVFFMSMELLIRLSYF
jgi:uncharacterized protein (DUF2062 family)